MPSERRVAACLLMLLAAVPLLWAQLPEHVEVVAGPLAALLVATVVVLSPVPTRISGLVWAGACAGVLGASLWSAPAESWGILVLLPLGLALFGSPVWMLAIGAWVGPATMVALRGGSETLAKSPFGGSTPADVIGVAAVFAWVLWMIFVAVDAWVARRGLSLHADTASSIHEGIARDRKWLRAVADTVADPSMRGPASGVGLGEDALAMAARIEGKRVLLGWIEGAPLATMTAGWAVCAAARAGMRDPALLLKLARIQLDEIVPPESVVWLAIWDCGSGKLRSTRGRSGARGSRVVLTPRGPLFEGAAEGFDNEETLEGIFEETQTLGAKASSRPPIAGLVFAVMSGLLAAASVVTPSMPALSWLGTLALLVTGQGLVSAASRAVQGAVDHSEDALAEQAELHDDIRFQISALHGSLLAYRIGVGEYVATAHRLRGEVLDGTFADMLVDGRGNGRIFAGEVAGRGIAARFLGLAAQISAWVLIRSGRHDATDLPSAVVQQVRSFGRTLNFPVRFRLGMVTFRADGHCDGWGTLKEFVQVDGGSDGQVAQLGADEVWLDAERRVYLTPAAAVPGPEDRAPALARAEVARRILKVVGAGRWTPTEGSLLNLFSEVFDGRHAPAHGTLIELTWSRPHQPEEEEDDSEGTAEDPGSQTAAAQ